MAAFFAMASAFGCNVYEEPQEMVQEEEHVWRITLGLPDSDPETRLTYEEVDVNGRKAMKTLWEKDDVIWANGTPGDKNYIYKFELEKGEGTSIGVFKCTASSTERLPNYLSTNAWTIYYSEADICSDQDYLDFSYSGQVQNGNGSLEHLGKKHSLRLKCSPDGSYKVFDNAFIDLSGEEVDESACMKFNLKGLPEIVPTEIELHYYKASGASSSCFHSYNYLDTYWAGAEAHPTTNSKMNLKLEGFTRTSDITAYMMMSNYAFNVENGGHFRVYVRAADGSRYYCDKAIGRDAVLKGGRLHSITCTSWNKIEATADGFDDPENGIKVLQTASKGKGTDIVIMGDGFAKDKFDGTYEAVMKKAYNDFFSVEPYASLKDYFNVYYINAVSEDNHDAEPYFDRYGNQNGAINGSATTIFNTRFTPGATTITGENEMAVEYAKQAILYKGGAADEDEAEYRANRALIMVMVNVRCHAGTCNLVWTLNEDYGNSYSVAYSALGNSDEQGRWTTIHEAGGHGFGKLGDEYGGYVYTSWNTGIWNTLREQHSFGVNRNLNEYWTPEEAQKWSGNISWGYTTVDNVYWSKLISAGYDSSEGLGLYEGGNGFNHLYCRPTANSIMRNQFADDGRFFNAISRWAIWYRLMRLTESTDAADFNSSLNEFLNFDSTISIDNVSAVTRSTSAPEGMLPLAPPVMIQGRWVNGKLVIVE